MTLKNYLEGFLDSLARERGRSPRTVQNYQSALAEFCRLCPVQRPRALTPAILDAYVEARAAELSATTLQVHRAALRGYLRYLGAVGATSLTPAAVVRPRLAPLPLTPLAPAVCTQLQTSLRERDVLVRRDAAVIACILETGLRVAVLTALNRADVDLAARTLTRPHTVSLRAHLTRALCAYLALRTDDDPALFVRHGNNLDGLTTRRLSPRSVERLVQKRARAAGIAESVTPERLRATYRARQEKAPGR